MPRKRPFQFAVGMPIQIFTLSPMGGCVVIAVTRQMPGFAGSTVADSMIVFGSATIARLSQDRTGFAFAIAGLGVVPKGGCARALRIETAIRVTSDLRIIILLQAGGLKHYSACVTLTSNTKVHYLVPGR